MIIAGFSRAINIENGSNTSLQKEAGVPHQPGEDKVMQKRKTVTCWICGLLDHSFLEHKNSPIFENFLRYKITKRLKDKCIN